MAFTVEGKNALRKWIKENGIGSAADFDLLFDGERFEVEDGDGIFAAVAGVAAAVGGVERYAMHAGGVGNLADLFTGLGIDDHDAGGAGNKQAMAIAVGFEVVPAAVTA